MTFDTVLYNSDTDMRNQISENLKFCSRQYTCGYGENYGQLAARFVNNWII